MPIAFWLLLLNLILVGCSSDTVYDERLSSNKRSYNVRIEIWMHGEGFMFYGDMSDLTALDENGLFVRRTYDGLTLPVDKTVRLNTTQPIIINGYVYQKDAEVLFGQAKISLIDIETKEVIKEEVKVINKYLGSSNTKERQQEISRISLVLSP